MIIDVTSEKAPTKWSSLPMKIVMFCLKILSNFGFTSEKKVFFVFLVLAFLTS